MTPGFGGKFSWGSQGDIHGTPPRTCLHGGGCKMGNLRFFLGGAFIPWEEYEENQPSPAQLESCKLSLIGSGSLNCSLNRIRSARTTVCSAATLLHSLHQPYFISKHSHKHKQCLSRRNMPAAYQCPVTAESGAAGARSPRGLETHTA